MNITIIKVTMLVLHILLALMPFITMFRSKKRQDFECRPRTGHFKETF